MKSSKIRWLIVLMSVSLLGIGLLQAYWIKHDISLKEQQFDQSVAQALHASAEKIESREVFHYLKNKLLHFDQKDLIKILMNDTLASGVFKIDEQYNTLFNELPMVFNDHESGDVNIEFQKPGSHQPYLRLQKKNFIKQDSLTERSINSSQITRVFDNNNEIVIKQNRERIKSKMDQLNKVMEQFAVEFVGSEGEVTDKLNPATIDSILNMELKYRGITTPYDFGVYCSTNNQLLCNTDHKLNSVLLNTGYRTPLFPQESDLDQSNINYLLVHFPHKNAYVLSSVWLMLLGSGIFTAIIIFCFSYTIKIIYRQKKLSEIKSDFINNMTHEFKTPIATISLAVDAIKTQTVRRDEQKLNYFSEIIKEENKRMNAQVEHVLQMAQIEKGEITLNKVIILLPSLINDAVERIKLQLQSRNGHITVENINQEVEIYGDYSHLTNIIVNLLENAIKYSPSTPEIKIIISITNTTVQISVVDKGMGMNSDTQKKIFDKFYRATKGNLHDVKGFGLGLSYVKAIIEEHGGTIIVQSEMNKGSTFSVTLPLNK
jgi:two-component system, OmpR family, phosphate regulon sensor histidine kinase PhoR